MKKILLLSFSIFALAAGAQITITTADMPTAPKQYLQTIDTLPKITIGSAGANQIWSMSVLKDQKKDTLSLLAASATPYAAMFPTANLAYKTGKNFEFLNNGTTDLIATGVVTIMPPLVLQPLAIHFSPAETILKYPSTFGTTFTGTSVIDVKIAAPTNPIMDSVRLKSTRTKTSIVDAWGSITTPYGTFNCLRFQEIQRSIDSTFYRIQGVWTLSNQKIDSTKTYNWLTKNIGLPLVSAKVNFKTDSVERVTWLALPTTVGINTTLEVANVNVYPNPAQDQVRFKLDASKFAILYICDISGKKVYTTTILNDITTVNLSKFVSGTYNYSIISKDYKIVKRGKFNVTK
ncbi:MAG: T9SS type A sorting domain-containing protein [Bacteroidia bacterium]